MSMTPIQPVPLVMTTAEVAELLRCSPMTVERYVFRHRLAAIRIGRERRFRAADVLDFVAGLPITAQCDRRHLRRKTAEPGASGGR